MDITLSTLLVGAALAAVALFLLRAGRLVWRAMRGRAAARRPLPAAATASESYRDLVRRLAPDRRATADALLGVEVEILGERLHCECLPLDEGFYWAQVLAAARAGNPLAQLRMGDFPAVIAPEGKAELFQLLQVREVYALADRFLAHERPGVLKGIDPAATTETIQTETTNSTGGSTT